MTAAMTPAEAKFLLDPYLDWTKREGIPVHEGVAVDLMTAETGPWPRLGDGCRGAFVHLDGRGDWMTVFLLDVPPGSASAPQRHLYDEVFYVLAGTGRMVVEMPDGGEHAIDFGPRSLFAPPLNARHRIVNGSRRDTVRLASANDLRILMNIFHDEAFFFDNPFAFPERQGHPGLLSENSMGAQASEIPAGTYEKAHRNGEGLHIVCIQGAGYTLLWHEGSRDFQRVDWRPGLCFALPESMIHQHFNTGAQPAQYLAVGFGTRRYPIVFTRHPSTERTDGAQIEYADQDPHIHALWLEELRKTGVRSEMTHGLPLHSRLA
jgi:oxalate decarboxylase/phosphoglucose isomerase-like protein (cupin superfamily)